MRKRQYWTQHTIISEIVVSLTHGERLLRGLTYGATSRYLSDDSGKIQKLSKTPPGAYLVLRARDLSLAEVHTAAKIKTEDR